MTRHDRRFQAFVSRRRAEENLLSIPNAFDLSDSRDPWSAPPTQCRFFNFLEEVDPAELQQQRLVQTRRLKKEVAKT